MTDATTTEAEFDAARYKADHLAACQTIAAMHKAAVGETRGPTRGVVEDVADVRAALDRVTAELDRLASLDTVTRHDLSADSFGVGARWAIRMIREAIDGDTHATP